MKCVHIVLYKDLTLGSSEIVGVFSTVKKAFESIWFLGYEPFEIETYIDDYGRIHEDVYEVISDYVR